MPRKPKRAEEWVGGVVELPSFAKPGEPVPAAAMWLTLPDNFVLAALVGHRHERDLLTRALLEARFQPMNGAEAFGKPSRLRVADEQLAAPIRGVFGKRVKIVVAPTPEVVAFGADFEKKHLARAQPRGNAPPSYFDGDNIPVLTISDLFAAAKLLFEAAPWDVLSRDEVLVVDFPVLGVEGICVCPMGGKEAAKDERKGLLIFASPEEMRAYFDGPRTGRSNRDGEVCALVFSSASELPASMRREAMQHGFEVAGVEAYPVVERRAFDGEPLTVGSVDVILAIESAFAMLEYLLERRPSRSAKPKKKGKAKGAAAPQQPVDTEPAYQEPQGGKILQLRVKLKEVEPEVWRRVRVSEHTTLHDLSFVINTALGWLSYHLYEFRGGPKGQARSYGIQDDEGYGQPDIDAATVTAGELFTRKGQKVQYLYDFGDDWHHEIVLEDVLPGGEAGVKYPVCLDGARACPPEDCGGPWGYADKLRALEDPKTDADFEAAEWMGEDFDAERFDLAEANEQIRKLPELIASVSDD